MDVSSVMGNYNMNSIWNSINPMNSSSSTVPLINNVDSSVQENYTSMNYFGQSTSSELQDIYQKVEPNYGMPLTYDQDGNFSIPSNTTIPTSGLPVSEQNIISLLNSNNSVSDNLNENILSQYTSIENGTFTPNISSILSANPYIMYNTINYLGNYQGQNFNNTINTSV